MWVFCTLIRNEAPQGPRGLQRCFKSPVSPISTLAIGSLFCRPLLFLLIAHSSAVGPETGRTTLGGPVFETRIKSLSSEKNINVCFGGPLFSLLVQMSSSCGSPLAAELWFG